MWLLEVNKNTKGKQINNAEMFVTTNNPNDFFTVFNNDDYNNILKTNKFEETLQKGDFENFGEIDFHSIINFKAENKLITNCSINLMQSGFSRRAWSELPKDTYKSNGRVRHERLNVQVGPLMNIQVHSYQAYEIKDRDITTDNRVGSVEHFDIYIFRNNELIGGKTFEMLDIANLSKQDKEYFNGYNEKARENCFKLYEMIKEEDIEILVNNAGFGTVGNFTETDLDTELAMIDTNCVALHILFKLILKDMVKKNNGRILNVASIASFSPGPNMATYFSTKSYVYRLTQSVYQELKWKKSKVTVTALCPSPTRTSFDKTANVKFKMNYLTSEYVAKCGVKAMLRGKWCVTPGFTGKIDKFFAKLLPDKIMAKVVGRVPSKRNK